MLIVFELALVVCIGLLLLLLSCHAGDGMQGLAHANQVFCRGLCPAQLVPYVAVLNDVLGNLSCLPALQSQVICHYFCFGTVVCGCL